MILLEDFIRKKTWLLLDPDNPRDCKLVRGTQPTDCSISGYFQYRKMGLVTRTKILFAVYLKKNGGFVLRLDDHEYDFLDPEVSIERISEFPFVKKLRISTDSRIEYESRYWGTDFGQDPMGSDWGQNELGMSDIRYYIEQCAAHKSYYLARLQMLNEGRRRNIWNVKQHREFINEVMRRVERIEASFDDKKSH